MTKQTLPIVLSIILTTLGSCRNNDRNFNEVRNLSQYKRTDFTPTLENRISKERNSIYCVTFLYAWDEIRKKIKTPLQIEPTLSDLTLINNSKSFIGALKDEEYKVSGIVEGNSISAKAEFKKSLPFKINLTSFIHKLKFENISVESFGLKGSDYQRTSVVEIIYYQDDDNFIIKLHPKDKKQEILLFKSEKQFETLAEMCTEVENLSILGDKLKDGYNNWRYCILEDDEIIIPKINFNIKTDYKTLVGETFLSNKIKYKINNASQRTAFVLNESGAKIESEAYGSVTMSLEKEKRDKPKPKIMKFDKPFLLVLKRTDSSKPYFAIWMTNPELMIKNN